MSKGWYHTVSVSQTMMHIISVMCRFDSRDFSQANTCTSFNRLINKLRPGMIPRIGQRNLPFVKVSSFLVII
jgi:hypothetical protein